MVFQKSYLLPHLTVGQNVEVGLKLQGKPTAFRREKALMILEKIGMADFYSRPISSLSGGQEQRVALARSIIITPQLLLLDEPFSQLDLTLRKQMGEWLRVIRHTFNLTMIMVTHDRDEALMLGDQFLLMREGKLEMAGNLRDVYYDPNSLWTATFMGFDNVIKGVKTGSTVRTVLGDLPIHPRLRSMPDGELIVVLRSEWLVIDEARAGVDHLHVAKEAGSRGSRIAVGESTIDAAIDIGSHVSSIEYASGAAGGRAIGYVLEAKFTGSQMEIKLRVEGETLIVKQLGYHAYDSGSTLSIHCTQSEVWCLAKVVGE
jgi:ABC-type Fe3+/spermidine/putrescine transport system ATPase subunit